MTKDKGTHTEMFTEWYDLWTKQSKEFYESAEKNLKDMFGKNARVNPEDHLKQINDWMETLKHQWQFAKLSEEQKAFANYWQSMAKMCQDASELMLQQWIKQTKENKPINNVRELYELWLNCCNEIYKKSMQTKSYQETYAEFMNTAMKFWKSHLPKE